VVALMQEMSGTPVKTFSIGFTERDYDEAVHAKKVAQHLGTEHHELYVTPEEAMAVIPRLPAVYSEPFADSSQVPTYLVSALARRHVTVSLSGDGGDELFCGYRRYQYAAGTWPHLARIPAPLRRKVAALIKGVGPRRWDAIAAASGKLVSQGRRPTMAGDKLHKAARIMALSGIDEVYAELVSHWTDAADVVIGAEALTPALDFSGAPAAAPVRRMMFLDMIGYLPDDILVKVDRAAMAVSLETRVPLLDHRLVEFTWSLPESLLRRGGRSKWILREMLHTRVPRELIERPKAGFAIPLTAWLRGPLREWAEGLLGAGRLEREGYLRPAPIRRAWQQLLDGAASNQERIWNVLMFQAWLEASTTTGKAKTPHSAALSSL
jgi:asparagine synthase (glutamine-hydrolysing)